MIYWYIDYLIYYLFGAYNAPVPVERTVLGSVDSIRNTGVKRNVFYQERKTINK